MPDILLYDCPPFHARISAAQCKTNKKKSKRAPRSLRCYANPRDLGDDRTRYGVCRGCPGVVALAERGITAEPRWWGAEREQQPDAG